MKKYIILIVLLITLTACQQKPIGGDRDQNGCLTGAGYSYDEDVGACTRNWELDDHEKEVVRNVLMVQSYSSYTIVNIEKIEDCNDCYDVTLQRNPIDEETKKEKYLEPYVIPYREGRIDYSYDDKITNFEECIAAGNPAMESYPRQCRDPISDRTFTEEVRQVCTEDEKKAEMCTTDYNPVCGEIVLNTGETTYKTFSNSCGACSSMKVIAYTPGECQDKQFVVCDGGSKTFDPKEYAQNNNGICVERCPEGFDAFTTQIGIQLCIPHRHNQPYQSLFQISEDIMNVKKSHTTTTLTGTHAHRSHQFRALRVSFAIC